MRDEERLGLPRWLDVMGALAGLVLASPLVALATFAVKLCSRGPVLFRQERIGRDGRPFTLLKLRTMRTAKTGAVVTAAGDPRVTAVGRLLRKTKLDELPKLWNVVRGEMALVGPRPEVPSLVRTDEPAWRKVLAVRPGVTDPVTLALLNEEKLLASVADPEAHYQEHLLEFKLEGLP